eukprot:10487975-Prorocentrum_lima.AAC.1
MPTASTSLSLPPSRWSLCRPGRPVGGSPHPITPSPPRSTFFPSLQSRCSPQQITQRRPALSTSPQQWSMLI